jgi:hypothetical protein
VVDRRDRQAGPDQLDPPAVDDLVVGRRRHADRPSEVVGDAHVHRGSLAGTPSCAGPISLGAVGVGAEAASPGMVRARAR